MSMRPLPGPKRAGTLEVRAHACPTCIYRTDSANDIEQLEAEVRDEHGFYVKYRICHYHEAACCRGFWNRHRDRCEPTQLAQRLGVVVWIDKHGAPVPHNEPPGEQMVNTEQEYPRFPRELAGQGGHMGTGHPKIDRRSLERVRLVVAKIDAQPDLVEVGVQNLERWIRQAGDQPNRCNIEWLNLIRTTPWSELRNILLDESDEGQRIRSSQPFAGLLTEEELRTTR